MANQTIVIVGASVAGAKAAEGAREAGFDGRIVLVGEEARLPYERPPLSKEVLRGEKGPEKAEVHPQDWYDEHDVELLQERVTGLDAGGKRVLLEGGGSLAFDAGVLATGAEPRRLSVPGADLQGVRYLRSLDDSLSLQDAIRGATRVAVVGSGWIGSEVAASARQMGADVVLIDPLPVPLQRVMGDEIGGVFRDLHADNGVTLRLGTGVTELRGGGGVVEQVVLDDGRTEDADLVVVGVGVTPRVQLAEAAGLEVDNGVVVDQYLRTSNPNVLAAGDIANAWHPFFEQRIRVEHWANALNQGMTAGHNATREQKVYDRLPYFFSDQYDLGMEYVGYGGPGDEVAIRGDLAKREFIAFWHRGGVVKAAMNVNVWDVVEDLKAIITSRQAVSLADVSDPGISLADLIS